jgi:dihydroneopterin aldolase
MNNELINFPKTNLLALKEWRILIQNWIIPARVGIWPEEAIHPQDIRVTITCDVQAPQPIDTPTIEGVVCYDQLMKSTQNLIESQHYYLLETLSETIATHCLQDTRIQKVFVRIEKIVVAPQEFCFAVELTRRREANT